MTTRHSEGIKAWLHKHAIALAGTEPDTSEEDLAPLTHILTGVDVVALGESNHGTREFFQVRHRMIRFLVRHMGFNVLAMEASYSAARALNDYIVYGKGSRSTALTDLRSAMWDVAEFGEILEWLRTHNAALPEEKRVRIFGADILQTRFSREHVLAYLRKIGSDQTDGARRMFERIGKGEADGLLMAHKQLSSQLLHELRDLEQWFDRTGKTCTSQKSANENRLAAQHLRVVVQWVAANVRENSEETGLDNIARSGFLAENILGLLASDEPPKPKVILWAHNFHVVVGCKDAQGEERPNLGLILREKLGARYYVFALEMDHGAYTARQWLADRSFGELTVGHVSAAPEGTIPWYFSSVGLPALLLDFRGAPQEATVEEWLTTPQTMYCMGWALSDPPLLSQVVLQKAFDGIVFIETSTPTRPTENAVASIQRREAY